MVCCAGEKKGTLYASDSGGTFFSLSLKDHFVSDLNCAIQTHGHMCTHTHPLLSLLSPLMCVQYNVGHHDFYEVKSVRGVYITSVMVEDGIP